MLGHQTDTLTRIILFH